MNPKKTTSKQPVNLFDGEWHHLHRGTPFFQGGILILAALGFLINELRDTLFNEFFQFDDEYGGIPTIPAEWMIWVIVGLVVLLIFVFVMFYLSWRMHTFRITAEVIEVRSGIIFRRHRKARIDRIQGININRPIVPRLFSAAKLEISGAGAESSISLNYLASEDANQVRRGLLLRASGAPDIQPNEEQVAGAGGIDSRIDSLLAPELDDFYVPESLVKIPTGRLIGSVLLSMTTIILVLFIVGIIIAAVTVENRTVVGTLLISLLPGMLAFGGFYLNQVRKRLRYSIADTPHGVRVGFGLASLTNDTVPPQRIHAIELRQPLLWRKAGWWSIEIKRATMMSLDGGMTEVNTTILPVGTIEDTRKVLTILLPDYDIPANFDLLRAGLIGKGTAEGFRIASKRAFWYQPLSWRRNGWNLDGEFAYLRTGVFTRRFSIIPFARIQSVSLRQGFGAKLLDLAAVELDLVLGPVNSTIWNIDSELAIDFFTRVRERALAAVNREAEAIAVLAKHPDLQASDAEVEITGIELPEQVAKFPDSPQPQQESND